MSSKKMMYLSASHSNNVTVAVAVAKSPYTWSKFFKITRNNSNAAAVVFFFFVCVCVCGFVCLKFPKKLRHPSQRCAGMHFLVILSYNTRQLYFVKNI
jgi:hypothetical protein